MKTIKVFLLIALVVGIFAAIKQFVLSPSSNTKPVAPSGGSMGTPVSVYVLKPQKLDNNVFATGTIIANEEVILMPEISGKIVFLNINEGSAVHKGDLLMKINDADFQAQLKKMELQLQIAEEKQNRLKQLLTINGISQEEYDVAVNIANTSRADIEYTKAQIAKTELRAPFNGMMGLKYVSEGSTITASTRIASIQQINPVKIDFSIPEKYVGLIKKNDLIHFTANENMKSYQAKIYAIEPKIDQTTRTIQLRAIADNSNSELYVGTFAKIELPLQKIENALMIPTEAIIPILKGKKVFLCQNGKAKEVLVETGVRTDSQVQILSGLTEGDSVITTGIMQLKPGSPLKIVNANSSN